jgi:hypothetical protein
VTVAGARGSGAAPGGTAGPPGRARRPADAGSPGAVPVLFAVVAAALLAWAPFLGFVAYPFRLLTTLVHELGHGLAALATGGDFLRFVVFPDGSGLAYTAGGWRLVVIPAGYLGAAAFGAVLILTGRGARAARAALGVVGAGLLVLTLRYALPSLFTAEGLGGLLALVSGLALGAAALWLAVRASAAAVVFAVHLIAFQAGLTAFADLWTLIGLSRLGGAAGAPATDARAMAEIIPLPAVVWAALWALLAAVLLAGALRAAWGGERKSNDAPGGRG